MAGHTPGPWCVNLTSSFVDGQPFTSVWIEAGPFRSIANLMPVPSVEANARLIAAAPDLLGACQEALRWYGPDGDHISEPTRSVLIAAIAKAEGRT